MNRRFVSVIRPAATGLVSLVTIVIPGVARSQAASETEPTMSRRGTIELPSLAMADALARIAAQSGVRVVADPDAINGLMSAPVVGATSARDAVRQATRGAPVAVRVQPDGSLAVFNDIVVVARRDEAETSVLVRGDTSSSRLGQSLRSQARNTQVISSKLIEEQQAQTLTDALRNAGGVVVNTATVQGGVGYSVRGFTSNGSVNGLPTAASSSFAVGSTQPIANIERLEVLKGPDAILLGGNNLGGTVNIVTKKPSADERLYMSAETGSFGQFRGTIDANNALTDDRRLSARVIAAAATSDRNFGGYRGNEDYLFAPSVRYKTGVTDIILSATLGNQIFGVVPYTVLDPTTRAPFAVPTDRPLVGGKNQFIQVGTTQFNGEITQQLANWLTIVARAQHQDMAFKLSQYSPFGLLSNDGQLLISGSGVRQAANTDAFDAYARFDVATGPLTHRLIAGATDVHSEVAAENAISGGMFPYNFLNPTTPLPALASQYAPSFTLIGKQRGYYGQYLVKLWRLHLLAGVRRNETESRSTLVGRATTVSKGVATTPNYGAVLDVTDNLSLFGSLAYGFQPTFVTDRNGNRLPDVRTRNAEAGVKLDLLGDRVLINASWFRIRQSNLLVTDPAASRFQIAAPGQEGTGIDLNVTGEPVRGLSIAGSLTRTTYKYLTATTLGNVVAAQPRDQYSLYTSYHRPIGNGMTAGLGAGVYGRSRTAVDRRGVYYLPPSVQVDANGFLKIGRLDVNLGVRNLFNRQNYNPTITPVYVPLGEPRSWRLTLGYRFR